MSKLVELARRKPHLLVISGGLILLAIGGAILADSIGTFFVITGLGTIVIGAVEAS